MSWTRERGEQGREPEGGGARQRVGSLCEALLFRPGVPPSFLRKRLQGGARAEHFVEGLSEHNLLSPAVGAEGHCHDQRRVVEIRADRAGGPWRAIPSPERGASQAGRSPFPAAAAWAGTATQPVEGGESVLRSLVAGRPVTPSSPTRQVH